MVGLVPGPLAAAVPISGTLDLLVVRAGFPDLPLVHDRAYFAGTPSALLDRLGEYWTEVSAGKLTIVPTLAEPVVVLPEPRAAYVERPDALARDALAALGRATPAGRTAPGADALLVFFAGPGRESQVESGDPAAPWSNYTTLDPPATYGAARFDEALVIAEEEVPPFVPFGVLCHEFGHLLGLPELYAPGESHEGIGVWGLMGQGTWLRRGDRPPHLSAWSKLRLGWVDADTITETTRAVTLPAVTSVPRVVKIPAAPGVPEEYYLLENRERAGADAALPGEGLLVWHVDEHVHGFRTAQRDAGRKLLHLVEADGRGDLDRGHGAGGNRGDATDPWRGPPPWRARAAAVLTLGGGLLLAAAAYRVARPRPLVPALLLCGLAAVALLAARPLRRAPVCGPGTPGMSPHGGGPVRVVIRNVSPPGENMRFDVLVAP